jgi:hypothetical protein
MSFFLLFRFRASISLSLLLLEYLYYTISIPSDLVGFHSRFTPFFLDNGPSINPYGGKCFACKKLIPCPHH